MTEPAPERPPEPPLGSARARVGRLFKNTGIYALGEAGVKLLTALLLPILAMFLPPTQLGLWSLALMFYTGFMNLCNPALHGSVTRFYFDHEHEHDAQRRFQGTILSFLLIWSLGLCVIATFTGEALFDVLFQDLPFWPYGVLVVWMVFLGVLGVVPKAIWVAAEKSKPVVGINLLGNAIYALGAVGLVAFTGLGVLGLFVARTASLAVLAVPLLIYSLRRVGLAWSWADLRSALRFSIPLVPHLLAHWVLGMADRLIIEHHYAGLELAAVPDGDLGAEPGEILGLHAVGIYATAYVFTEVVIMVGAAMNSAWVPQFTRAHARPEERGFVARSITYFMLAVGAMSAALVVLSPTVVRMFLPTKYVFAAGIAPILAFGGLFQGLYYVYVAVLFYNKANRLLPVITVVSGAINVALNLLWLPTHGLAGAAWATVISYAVLVVGVRWASRRFPMPLFEVGRLARIAAVLVVVAVAGVVLDDRLPLVAELVAKLGLLGLGAAALWGLGVFAPRG
jgi:O-antigen/teichoic acid export membrane protein